MKKPQIREKKHRLHPDTYIGNKIISFTGCVKERKALFKATEDTIFLIFEGILIKELREWECEAVVYLFMPDHFHFILSGKNETANIKKCIDAFKQKTGFWLSQNKSAYKWQKDYYDHVIRSKDDLRSQIWYVLNNPVRANIVEDWRKYKFKGSTVFNLDAWE